MKCTLKWSLKLFISLNCTFKSNSEASDSRSFDSKNGHLNSLTQESGPNRMIFGNGRSGNADKDSDQFAWVRKGNFFVDKTEFIRDFFELKDDFVYITAPPRFGKSVNLDMIRLFAETRVEANGTVLGPKTVESFKLFHGTKIAAHRIFFNMNCQKYAVIRMDFGQFELVENYETFQSEFCSIICNTMLFQLQFRSFVENFMNMTGEHLHVTAEPCHYFCRTNFEKSLLLSLSLPRALQSTMRRKVIVLIDKYDSLLQALVDRRVEDLDKITHDLGFFMRNLIKENDAVTKGLFVGILTCGGLLSTLSDNVAHVKFDRNQQLGKYFGFTLDEVRELLMRFNQTENLEKVRAWYEGFTVENAPGLVLFNPVSIDMYLSIKKCEYFWMEHMKNLLHLFHPYFSHPKIGGKIEQILFGDSSSFSFTDNKSTSWQVFDKLRLKIEDSGEIKKIEDQEVSFLMQILVDSGYFSLQSADYPKGLRSSNKETERIIEMYLFQSNYFQNVMHVTEKVRQDFRAALVNLSEKDKTFQELAKAFHELFVKDCSSVQSGEITVQGILLSSLKYIFHLFDHTADIPIIEPMAAASSTEEWSQHKHRKKTTVLLIRRDQVGIILEIKLRRSSEEVLRELLRNGYWNTFQEKHPLEQITQKIILGVNIDAKCGCQISYLFNCVAIDAIHKVQYP